MTQLSGQHGSKPEEDLRMATLHAIPGESYFTLEQIAQQWQISIDSARRIFGREPGVLRFNAKGHRSTPQGRVRLRVPNSVYQRVLNQLRHLA